MTRTAHFELNTDVLGFEISVFTVSDTINFVELPPIYFDCQFVAHKQTLQL